MGGPDGGDSCGVSNVTFGDLVRARLHAGTKRADPLREVETRLACVKTRIGALSREEVATYPERTASDWPKRGDLGLDLAPLHRNAADRIWAAVIDATETRVQAIDPEAGGTSEAFCWPVWSIYDRHWLAVMEAAMVYAVAPLLSSPLRARFEPQLRLWQLVASGSAS